jgi:hypothetical protein
MQRREEGAGTDGERTARDLLDPARNTKAVELTKGERLEDQEIEGPLEEIGLGTVHGGVSIGCR